MLYSTDMNITEVLLFAACAYAILMGYALTRPRSTGTFYFMLVLLVSLLWDISYYLELTLPNLEAKVFVHLARFVFLPWLTMLWLAMIRSLLGIGKRLPRWFWGGLVVIGGVSVLAAVTSGYHHVFQYDFAIHPAGAYGILIYTKGPWYAFYELFQVAICWLTMILMFKAWSGGSPIMRQQLRLLILGYGLPFAMNMIWAAGFSPVPHVNLAPFTTIFSISAFAWVVFRYHALDIVPVARGVLMDQMIDLVFVTDNTGLMIDLNDASCKAVGKPLMACVGHPVSFLPSPWGEVLQGNEGVREISVRGTRQWFDVSVLGISAKNGVSCGRLIILRDITTQHDAELALRDSEAELRLILDSISEAVFVHNPEGMIVAVNKPLLTMYGLEQVQQALKLRVFADYSAPDNDFEAAQAALGRVMEGERIIIPRWKAMRPLTRALFDVQIVLQRINKDGRQLILATVTDITEELLQKERQLAWQKLRNEKKQLRQQELIVRDIHDGIGGLVAGIGMISAMGLKEQNEGQRATALRNISNLAAEANVEIRGLMNTLESSAFLWSDLIVEMRHHGAMIQDNSGIIFEMAVEREGDFGGPGLFAGMSLLRIFKEALNNVAKHSGAERVVACLSLSEKVFRLGIKDNGCGMNPVSPSGRGIRNMRHRIEEFGGILAITMKGGLQLEFEAPLPLKALDQSIDIGEVV